MPPHPTLSHGGERREKKDEKNLTESPHPTLSRGVERVDEGKRISQHPSLLFSPARGEKRWKEKF